MFWLDATAYCLYVTYLLAWLVHVTAKLFARQIPLVHHIGAELRPFVPAAMIGSYLAETILHGFSWWRPLLLGWLLWGWWATHDDFDDRWRRRGRRLRDTVRSVGHRLHVVPAGE